MSLFGGGFKTSFLTKITSVKISRDILTFVKQNSEIDQKKIGRSVRFESPDLSSPAPSVQGPTGPKIRPLRLMLWDQTWKFEFDRLEDGSSPIGVRSTLSGWGSPENAGRPNFSRLYRRRCSQVILYLSVFFEVDKVDTRLHRPTLNDVTFIFSCDIADVQWFSQIVYGFSLKPDQIAYS